MLFTKEELAKEVENTGRNEVLKRYPFQHKTNSDDITPYETIYLNKVRYFDLKSHAVKQILYNSRKNVAEKCFKEIEFYPNEEKINRCIKENSQEFTKLEALRELHFGNIFDKYQRDYQNCPSNDSDCRIRVQKELAWNAAKLPYFFAESQI